MKTLLLDVSQWDLVLDAAGNIAVAADPYSRAQDVASALRLFSGELWYDTSKGIPYFQQILGKSPPITVFKTYMIDAAKTVPGVVAAQCVINSFEDRTVQGSVTFQTIDGQTGTVALQ